ncbi:carboxylesterase [Colletotrichum zoysiae]|uniref:Carboxylesterase n=1 Tax=Colletotrichum zoysiae TaxID=1216348 RepID=A0AAD9LXY0_9PEZI|nr:carboxylesterase [Colletotrichum zoysiae]
MASATQHLEHPVIGTVEGVASDGVIQFLGVKYANLDHWFDDAQLVRYKGNGLNATRHGPQVISDPAGVNKEHLIIQKAIPVTEFPGLSSTECLNLNLTVPLEAKDSQPLPVLVFIHGGGFMTGSNWWPQYDMKRIVQLASQRGKPIIAAAISYRVGAPGFLTSEELRKEGYRSNHGHHDQRVALKWIKEYIAGFGGDPRQVTVAGESAGGGSTTRMLYSNEALAARIIVLGGCPPLLAPLDAAIAEQSYHAVIKAFKFEDLSPSQRINSLSEVSPEDLLAKLGSAGPFMPILDGDTVPFTPTFETSRARKVIPSGTSCQAMMIGYAPLDASIFGFMFLLHKKERIATKFIESVSSSLSQHPGAATRILQVYEIGEATSDDEALIRILQFASDLAFRAPAELYARSFHGDSYLLEFAERNPWEGPFTGHSTHVLDVAFLFQNYNEHLGKEQRQTAEAFAADVIAFVRGEAPWRRLQETAGRMVYEYGMRTYKEDGASPGRYDSVLGLGEEVGLDSLLKAWETFLFSRPSAPFQDQRRMVGHALDSESLGSTLLGVELERVVQFRGIPYGEVPSRFAEPRPKGALPREVGCTSFGPRCPQAAIDVGHLLRIPSEHKLPSEHEDEFKCLNLDVTTPKACLSPKRQRLPVVVWIHGGSQAVTFGSAASGVCDGTQVVEDSISQGKPIIVVTVQYRLNIFAFGDDASSKNLALKDQALALDWVRSHIAGFGGDPNSIFLAGESAGAVYCHAHLVAGAPVRGAILSSGSLYLSPPQSEEKAFILRQTLRKHLQAVGDFELGTAPVEKLVEALESSGIQSWFLRTDSALEDWQAKTGVAERLMIGDVQNEAVIWRAAVWAMDNAAIVDAFDLAGEDGEALKRIYNIHPGRPSSSRIGALDFINDYKFLLPAENIARLFRATGRPAYRYLVDEPNPWQPSNGAHHAVDLLFLFGGFDLSFSPSAKRTGEHMRKAFIEFVHSQEPWSPGRHAGFGPYGSFQELDSAGVGCRRRMKAAEFLQGVSSQVLDKVFFALAAGRISLSN